MADLRFVTYCGLYCGLCSARSRGPQEAKALHDTMRKEGYESWGGRLPNFKEFWAFLTDLADIDKACPGCRQDGGPPLCGIRKCARQRGVDICAFCDEFPCHRIEALAQGYHMLIPDCERMRRIGIDAWIAEQEERASTGFCYLDVRCHPYSVPED